MIIYTVVGRIDYEGISNLIKSFTHRADAEKMLAAIGEYNGKRCGTGVNHPAFPHSFCDSYDIEEHNLEGLIDVTVDGDGSQRLMKCEAYTHTGDD